MAIEQTFVMIKPDGVQRGLMGKVVSRLEDKGLKLVAMKFSKVNENQANDHYGFLKEKPFYTSLISFITSSPVVKMVWEGEDAIRFVRILVGATNPIEAAPGSIRSDYAVTAGNNIIHASDSVETSGQEIERFFNKEEIMKYSLCRDSWLGV